MWIVFDVEVCMCLCVCVPVHLLVLSAVCLRTAQPEHDQLKRQVLVTFLSVATFAGVPASFCDPSHLMACKGDTILNREENKQTK